MKTILMALAVAGMTYANADAKTYKVPSASCGKSEGKVCRKTAAGKHCYKTRYAQNFKVCKGNTGYFICCERPGYANSTHPKLRYQVNEPATYIPDNPAAMVSNGTPGQTYPWMDNNGINVNNTNSYEGYYPNGGKRSKIKVCYTGENVAELNKAVYNGCNTPAWDGPEKNNNRNLNVSTPNENAPLAPISGNNAGY